MNTSHLLSPAYPDLIYLPAFNCEKTLEGVFSEIPRDVLESSAFLVIDNCSTDRTAEVALKIGETPSLRNRFTVLRTKKNLGYAGSQKLAYRICRDSEIIRSVIMLHADGQYPAELLPDFRKALSNGADVTYGYRGGNIYRSKEETPIKVRLMIYLLSKLEGLATNYRSIKEWHSGFVGYSKNVLLKVNFSAITDTMHMDGNMLFAASHLGLKIQSIPIYKRYRNFTGFGGPKALLYICHCCRLMLSMRLSAQCLNQTDKILALPGEEFEIILSPSNINNI